MMRLISHCSLFVVFCMLPPHLLIEASLVENVLGAPQDLGTVSGVSICANRSSFCNVLLDVPSACAGTTSQCPIIFCLHGFGGSNKKYVTTCGSPVHSHNFIGVYPQGECEEILKSTNSPQIKVFFLYVSR